ncbi:protein kinase [Streptomyces sp. NPDC006602]|uniref:protein kinase domain-containing protein n=1 Tax=Streptomyces sp. NPDC006602 TaxID=3364751 RepID=UPI00369789BE
MRQTGAAPLRPVDPSRIGPYVPLALLGSGGMGRVYLARPTDGGPGLFAVKVIRPEYADDSNFRRRFEREASVHARLRTPHTPELCGTGFQDELLWMATEYLPGLDLSDAVGQDGALETAAVWRLVADLGQALAGLAAAGIVHRDLKPSNVLLSVRGAYVIDFGLSKAVDASALTGTGNRVGTPAYMSPEHLRTGRCDTASDVFSLAGTLVYAATGHAPFGDGTGVDVMHRVAFEEPYPELLGEIAAVDAALGSLLSACLAKEPEARPTPRALTETARAHAGTSLWPEPLGARVLARQRAYEVLHPFPATGKNRSPSPDDRPEAAPPTPAERVSRPAPPALGPAIEGAGPDAVTPPGRSRGVRTWARKKPVLAAAAGTLICAVAAGGVLLARQDAPATAAPWAGATAGAGTGSGSGDAGSSPSPGGSEGTSVAGEKPDGAASGPEPSAAADAERRTDSATPVAPAVPTVEPSVPADGSASSSPSSPPPEPAAPPWISDCTHYAGNGRTLKGDSGKRVLQVQCMLTKRGYGAGSTDPDGDFGSGTESAVLRFQSDKGLDADGIVARETWEALRGAE